MALAFLLMPIWQPARVMAAGPSPVGALANTSNFAAATGNQKSPLTWNLSARRIELAIVQNAATVRLLPSQLIEQTSKEPLDCRHFQLCGTEGACGQSAHLSRASSPIYLEVEEDFHPVGNYRGVVQVASGEAPGEPFPLDIYGTTPGRKALGVLVIALGVALAWAISVFARSRIDRDHALLPAVALRSSLDKLLLVLGQVPQRWSVNVTATPTAVRTLQNDLTQDSLDRQGLLPPQTPGPYPTTYSSMAYNQFLQAATEHANVLGVIVNHGMAQAWGLYRLGMTPAQMQAIAAALDALDALDAHVSPPQQAQAQVRVDTILANLRQTLGVPAALAAVTAPAPAQSAAKQPTYKSLSFQITRLTWMIWGALFLITVVTGFATLIQANAGFGLERDYLLCFLWGLGLPVGGLQLTALVPSSVSTALHVPIFK